MTFKELIEKEIENEAMLVKYTVTRAAKRGAQLLLDAPVLEKITSFCGYDLDSKYAHPYLMGYGGVTFVRHLAADESMLDEMVLMEHFPELTYIETEDNPQVKSRIFKFRTANDLHINIECNVSNSEKCRVVESDEEEIIPAQPEKRTKKLKLVCDEPAQAPLQGEAEDEAAA